MPLEGYGGNFNCSTCGKIGHVKIELCMSNTYVSSICGTQKLEKRKKKDFFS